MIFLILAYLTLFFHFIWILFLIFGFIFALKRSKIVWLHLGGLILALLLNLMGWFCPLTYLENYLYSLNAVHVTYSGPFVIQYLEKLIYPNLPERVIRIGEICMVSIYLVGYAFLFKRSRFLERKKTS